MMEIINLILGSDIFSVFTIALLVYVAFWLHRNRKIILVVGLIAIAGYIVYLQYSKKELVEQIRLDNGGFDNSRALGYRLNNPGNIRRNGDMWPGEVSTDAPFKQFSSMKYGFRAMAKLLHSYVRDGHNTIGLIINRYAPAGDGNNNPGSYARNVARNANVSIDKVLGEEDLTNGNMLNIMYAMVKVEQGYPPNIVDLNDGYVMYMNELKR